MKHLLFLLFPLITFVNAQEKEKICLIISFENFQNIEYQGTKEYLENKNYKIITASTQKNYATGKLGEKVKIDLLVKDIKVFDYVAIVFIGGSGSSIYWNNKIAHNICKETFVPSCI
ncbi:MAG: DJ-1/PfpI family protein [bacterium]